MIKRPKAIWLVAVWFFLGYSFIIPNIEPDAPSDATSEGAEFLFVLFLILARGALLLYVLIGMIQLRRVPCWLCVAFMSVWTAAIIVGVPSLFLQDEGPGVLLLFIFVVLILNTLTVWYLIRPTFRVLCTSYRKEKDAVKMQNFVAKQFNKQVRGF